MTDPVFFGEKMAPYLILAASILSILWGVVNAILIKCVDMTDTKPIEDALKEAEIEINDPEESSINHEDLEDDEEKIKASPKLILVRIVWIGKQITDGAISFLNQEYLYLAVFAAVFAIILGVTVDYHEMNRGEGKLVDMNFPYTAISFLIGSATSILAGYIGMRIAVFTNTRTTFMCCSGEKV